MVATCSAKSGKLAYKRMIMNRDNEEMFRNDLSYPYYSVPKSGRLFLNGGIRNYSCGRLYLNGRLYTKSSSAGVCLNGVGGMYAGSFKDWAKKAANTIKNVAKKGYSVFKKVYNPVKKVLKSDFVSNVINAIHPGAKKGMDIALNVIDSVENAIDKKSIKPVQDNEYVQEGIERGKEYLINKFKKESEDKLNTIKELSETPKSGILPSDYQFAKNIFKMIDVNALRRMQNNMTGGRVVKDLVNQILIDKNQDLRCGRLMVDKRYRKIFNIKPIDIKNKLNKKSLKELFNQPKMATYNSTVVPLIDDAPLRVADLNSKHVVSMENSSPESNLQQTSGKMKKNNRLNEVKNNDLYELLYGLK